MRRFVLMIALVLLLITPVFAMDFSAPEADAEYMPEEQTSFGQDLWYVLKSAIKDLQPALAEAGMNCLSILAAAMLISIFHNFPGRTEKTISLIGTLSISVLLIYPSNTLIQLGSQTVTELSDYGKLLLPVMTAALAAQGGTTASASLYIGTVFFDSLLTAIISKILIPLLYMHICLSVASSAIKESVLKKLKDFSKWLTTWILKIILYVFTGYMGITGVISGTADAAALKAAKLTISGVVPVVGGILSDASEAILVSAGVLKSTAGIYGVIAIIAIFIGPFLKIGVQYLLLKITSAICAVFSNQESAELVQDFSGAMGLLLAMTGTTCMLLLISTVCFMKGIS